MGSELEVNGIFPTLCSGVTKDSRLCVQEVATGSASEIRTFCNKFELSEHSFYLTLWALVLRAFVETDQVCIGFGDFRARSVEVAQVPLKAIHATISPWRSISQLLAELNAVPKAPSLNNQEVSHNTGVVLLPGTINLLELSWLVKSEYTHLLAVAFDKSTGLPEKLSIVYLSSHLSPFHAENISSNITQAVQQVLTHPNGSVRDIDLFSPLNTDIVSHWNAVRQQPACLLEVLHGHAKCRPDYPAICAWDGTVSYSELDILTTRWASYLQSHGVRPECLVPMMMGRSKWSIIGQIAVLKAGGAFVPLDSAQPVSRLEYIVQQTNSRIALSSAQFVDKLSNLVDNVIAISDEKTSSLPSAGQDVVRPDGFDRTAYVLFTSGSTGRPKGCVMKYGALSDVVNQTTALKITPESRVLQFASYTYGMALIEVHCTLAAGATICVPTEDDRLNCLDVVLRSMRVTWAILTPSAIWSIVESAEWLKTLVVAGEALTSDLLSSLAEKVELIQAFGLTEWSGICCVSHRISSENEMRVIGRSPTARLWLVDPIDSTKLAPVGAVSELLVEGPALADCYLGESHQTAAAFLERPPRPLLSTGARFYRTGDLVQYTADGSLRYISRKDNQVKIRGMRVELAEVEHRIRQAHALLEKVIVEAAATKGSRGIPILVAFLYTGEQSALQGQSFLHTIGKIKASLRLTLPDHMHPSVYIPLRSIPLTISRKVDRKALRQSVQESTREELERFQSSAISIVTPRTDVERQLRLLVAAVLHLDPSSFGMNQSFISLGGDSITAMLLVNNCKKQGFRATVAATLQAQTIADIASRLTTGAETSPESNTAGVYPDLQCATIPKLPHSGPVEQSFSQARMWFLQTLHPESTWLLLPSAVRLQGPLQVDALQTALSALVERHETLRTTFEGSTGSGVQLVAPFHARPLKVLDMASGADTELMTALHQQQMTAMDLTKECWRVALFRRSPTEHVLSVVLHHIICDGWSFDLFMKTLEVYYAAAVRGQNPLQHAEPLPIQYRDFSSWQQQGKASGIHDQLAYWVHHLNGSQPAEFLSDRKRPPSLSGRASSQQVKIDHSLYQALLRFCKSQQATPFTVLLAAFRATHYRLTGASDATIGIPCAARNLRELEGLIGYFGNVQCIRTKIEDPSQSFQQLVLQVRSATTAAFENQDVPFDQIVFKTLKGRDLSRHPLVQVAFILHSQEKFGQLRLEGLKTEQLPLPQSTRLDLEFHLHPGEGELHGEMLYSVDLFHPESIQAMLSVFYDVLRAGLRYPDAEIGSLPLTDAYPSLNQRGLVYPRPRGPSQECNIIDAFHQSVVAGPHEIAVRDTRAQLTYVELDKKSSTLAAWLTNRYSFAEETPIAVYANRSCESLIAILGILKAHLAYVPLDVNSPVHRTEMILSCLPDCQLVLLASDLTIPSVSPQRVGFAYVTDCFCADATEVDEWLRTMSPPRPTSLAYILFTSGTTGKPKGVMVEHHSVIRLAKDPEIVTHSLKFPVGAYLLNPAFDASGLEIYSTILNGGTLVCIDKSVVFDFPTLKTIFVENGVRRAVMTSAMLKQCLISSPSIMAVLEILYVGGDKLDPADIAKARGLGSVRIFNCYGPTENTVVSTRYDVPTDEAGINGIPIGRSIYESGAYVMDPNLRLVPIGVMGELIVTGLGLARGYTNPEHNMGRFVTIHINGVAERAYRTGDLVRYRPSDGQLEFFGRMDRQVKIRGHRIEPDEIDSILLSHSFINAAVTVVQMDDQDHELVSFVTIENTGPELKSIEDRVESEHVNAWKTLVEGEDHYGNVGAIQQSTLGKDFLGWVSMYNGEPMDKEEMSEWLEDTVATILQCGPSRVLEIGTGTGMILFSLIGSLQQYLGLEPSAQAAGFVQKAVHWVPCAAQKVRIQCGTASDLANVEREGPFDLAVMNSVVQYFPSLGYLRNVIKDLAHLHGMRCIVVGDILSYALYQDFQVSKVLHLHGHSLTARQLQQRMTEIVRREKELLVDPAFFTALATEMSDVVEHVEILPKRMKATNELSCYRYAAILHVKCPGHSLRLRGVEPDSWVDFEASGLNYNSLLQLLKMPGGASVVAVSNIPYKKTVVERHIVDSLGDLATAFDTTGWSQRAYEQARVCAALEPVDLLDLAQEAACQVEISWARQRSQRGGLDAIFHRPQRGNEEARVLFRFPTDAPKSGLLGNDPLALHRNHRVAELVLEDIRAKLPSYMVPKMVQVLDRMPVNNVGKVDRQALSQRADITLSTESAKPRSLSRGDPSQLNGVERVLWEEFTSALGAEVGITDSFFDLGGHSLMAIKLVSRINQRLGSKLRVSELFQYATIARLCNRVYRHRAPSSFTSAYKPFSLLGSNISSLESFSSSHLAEMGLPAGVEVLDIFPMTETQAWFISDWGLVSHSFVMNGNVDLDRLRAACQTVVRHHAVLRTLFTKFQKRRVQVICGNIEAPFSHEYIEPVLGSVSKSFCNDDCGGIHSPAKLFTAFSLTSLSTTEHIFTLQLSHAQYDGLSLSSILSGIASAYSGGLTPLTSTISFSHYIQVSRAARTHDTLEFWKTYLEGSVLTSIRLPTNAGNDRHADIAREVLGDLVPLPGITFPTLLNAAIALTLSGMAKCNDITFCCVMNARDILAEGTESVLGPCVSRSLLRVQVSEDLTALEFCRHLGDNQARVSAHNHFGLHDVIERCTKWPSSQMRAPFVTHLPADTAVPALPLPGIKVSHSSTDVRINPRNQVFVRSAITDQQKAYVQVQASSVVMDGDSASSLASRILVTAQALSKSPERHLGSIAAFPNSAAE